MGDEFPENIDSDKEYIDVELEGVDDHAKKPKPAKKLPVRRSHNSRFSLSQPNPARKRKCNNSPERGELDDPIEQKALMKVLNSLQKDVRAMKELVKKELPAMKTSMEEIKTELNNVKARVVAVAPPVNIETNLNELTAKVVELSNKVNDASRISSTQEKRVKLGDILEVDRLIKQRKMKFHDFHSYSERHAIYLSWEQQTPPFVMAKYLPVFIENEPEEEYNARKRKGENNRLCDMELLGLRAQRAKAALDSVDAEVAQTIQEFDGPDDIKENLLSDWKKMTKDEEEKSKKIWEKTAKNLVETPQREQDSNRRVEKDGKTYAAAVKGKSKKNSNALAEGEKDEEVMQVDPPEEAGVESQQQWTNVSGKNKRSHKQDIKVTIDNTKTPSKQNEGHQSNFRKKGPKFKPKSRGEGGWYHNHWGYQKYPQRNWW